MIKKLAINKITILFMYIILISIFYFIPTKNIENIDIVDNNEELNMYTVYLLDKDNYVSKINTYYNEVSVIDLIKYKIDILINGIDNSIFYPLIPKNTYLNSVKIDKDNVYLDFNNELFNIPYNLTESMIESIIYSLSDINGINNIYLSVNDKLIEEINDIKLEYPLTRNYGINKKYKLNDLNNINKTTVFFYKNINSNEYYVPVTFINNKSDDKINIIIEELKSSINTNDNLNGLINNDLEVISYNIDNNIMNIKFNEFNDINNQNILNVIYLSLMENYNISDVIIK